MNLYRYSDEENALESAVSYIRDQYGEDDLPFRSVLVLGCCEGDVMQRFSGLFSSVTILDPDAERCDGAMEFILDHDLENVTALSMDLGEYNREFPNQTFDIVLCGSVSRDHENGKDGSLTENLKSMIAPDSICLITKEFTDSQYSDTASEILSSCGPETASGKVCFMHYYYLNAGTVMNTAKLRRFQTEEGEEVEDIRAAFDTAEEFLYGKELPFPVERHYRKAEIRCGKAGISDSHIVVSFYPESSAAQVSVCLTLEDASRDDFVYLRQIRNAKEELFTVDGRPVSLPQLCEEVLKECGLRDLHQGGTSVIIELNRFGSCTDPLELSEEEQRCLYGILTGDEGYLYVPQSLAEERMAGSWTDRDYVKVFACNGNYVLLNFNRGETYADYIDGQLPYAERYYGGLNEYFTMDAPTAGIDHGLFFSVEKGQLIRTVSQRLMNAAGTDGIRSGRQMQEDVSRTLAGIERLTGGGPGGLESLVLDDLDVSGDAANIRSLLERVKTDLDLSYSKATNRMVTVLTILGLLAALVLFLKGF